MSLSVPFDLVAVICDYLCLPSAIHFISACKGSDTDIETVITRHHTHAGPRNQLLDECITLEEFGIITPTMLSQIWSADGLGFPWVEFLCVSVVRCNLPLVKFVCYSFAQFIVDADLLVRLHRHINCNNNNRRHMLHTIGLGQLELDSDFVLDFEQSLFDRVWRCITKALLVNDCRDAYTLLMTLCTCDHPHQTEWLSWYLKRFSPSSPNAEDTTLLQRALASLVTNNSMLKFRMLLDSDWVQGINLQPVLSSAIQQDNLSACVLLHRKARVVPQPEDKPSRHVSNYFLYATDPLQHNIHHDFAHIQAQLSSRLKDIMRVVSEEETEELERLPQVQELREMFKRKRELHEERFKDTNKRIRSGYLQLASVLSL